MKRFLFLLAGLILTNLAICQNANHELICSSGDSFNNSSYQIEWSVGECVTATFTEENYIINQGFHQNFYEVSKIDDFKTDFQILVYPNPTSDYINLEIGLEDFNNLEYIINDFSGRKLQTSEFKSNNEQINFQNYASGIYIVTILEKNQIIKTFQIIKN